MLTDEQKAMLDQNYKDPITLEPFFPFRFAFRQRAPRHTFFFGDETLIDLQTRRRNPHSNVPMSLYDLRIDPHYFLRLLEAKRQEHLFSLTEIAVPSSGADFKDLLTHSGVSPNEYNQHRHHSAITLYSAAAHRRLREVRGEVRRISVFKSRIFGAASKLAIIYGLGYAVLRNFNWQPREHDLFLTSLKGSVDAPDGICAYLARQAFNVSRHLTQSCSQDQFTRTQGFPAVSTSALLNSVFNLKSAMTFLLLMLSFGSYGFYMLSRKPIIANDLFMKIMNTFINVLGASIVGHRYAFTLSVFSAKFADNTLLRLTACESLCNPLTDASAYSLGSLLETTPDIIYTSMFFTACNLAVMSYVNKSSDDRHRQQPVLPLQDSIEAVIPELRERNPDSTLLFFEAEQAAPAGPEVIVDP